MRQSYLVFLFFFCFFIQIPWAGETKITASNAATNDRFGRSVAVCGNDLIVGASLDDGTGSAYIFKLNTGIWSEVKKLPTPTDLSSFDDFGLSVAIDGDYAVVGAKDNLGHGSAYVFCRDTGGTDNWGQVAKFTASDSTLVDEFGNAVAINGDYVVVGARGRDSTGLGNNIGAAYIFEKPPSGWKDTTQTAQLFAGDADAQDRFGLGVAIDSNNVLVGAANDENGGSVYFFQRDVSGNWSQQQKFQPTSPIANAEFGKAIAIDQDYAVIGSPNSATPDSGLAYMFQYNSGTNSWSEQAILLPHDRRDFNRFGNAVAINSNLALVGAWQDSSTYGTNSGVAYTFLRTLSSWQEVNQFIPSDGGSGDVFGVSVALHDNYALIGAPQATEITPVVGPGAVYSQKIDLFVDIALWLQGPYDTVGDTMKTFINDSIPLNNPYSASPCNYAGGDSIGVMRDTIVDWVLVELRTGTDANTAVDSCAAFISKSGKVVGISGSGALPLDVAPGPYYIAVRHRNHIAVMTSSAVTLSSRSLNTYDFTTATGQFFGGDAALLETGVFGMYAGDGQSDEDVDASDINLVWRPQNGTGWLYTTYGDYQMDGDIDASDINLYWRPNNGKGTQVP